jgi:hypothetical protein
MRSSLRILVAVASVSAGLLVVPSSASAAAAGGDRPSGTVTVGASSGGSTGGDPAGSTGGRGGGGGSEDRWQCVYTKLLLNDEGGIAPGGPTPGSWYSVTCVDRVTGANTTQTEWIPDQAAQATPAVNPFALALQAENSLRLPLPTSHLNPVGFSVVNLATWMWIDPGLWHSYSVTASVGSVSATAVATPVAVVWSTGDGHTKTCPGPGTPFDPEASPSQQSTECSHSYAVSSAGQPSPDGNPNDGAFTVSTTVDWSVSWSARGAVGGGPLPALTTSSSRSVRVEQVESVNSDWLSP